MNRSIPFAALSIVLLLIALASPSPTRAQDRVVGPEDSQAIQAVISGQLEAFQRDDGEAAFAFAAPLIRERFGDVANFMRMVRDAYQAVYRPRKVAFGEILAPESRLPVQKVFLVGPDGLLVTAHYIMERQAGGEWRIAGVYLLPAAADGPT